MKTLYAVTDLFISKLYGTSPSSGACNKLIAMVWKPLYEKKKRKSSIEKHEAKFHFRVTVHFIHPVLDKCPAIHKLSFVFIHCIYLLGRLRCISAKEEWGLKISLRDCTSQLSVSAFLMLQKCIRSCEVAEIHISLIACTKPLKGKLKVLQKHQKCIDTAKEELVEKIFFSWYKNQLQI